MRTQQLIVFVSRSMVVGALCALLWVVGPGARKDRNDPPPVAPVVTEEVAPAAAATEESLSQEKKKEEAPPVAKPVEEEIPKAREVMPYRGISERPEFVRSAQGQKKKESLRAVMPM